MARLNVNNLDYHYSHRGIGAPLILLHGFTGCASSWGTFVDGLMPQMEIIAIDLPGHGRSEKPQSTARYAIDQAAKDVVTIADQLGLKRFSLLGYSMGGRLALYLAHRYPDRIKALVLESASPGIADSVERKKRQEWDFALAEQIEQEGLRAFVDYWEQLPLFASQSAVPRHWKANQREQRLQNKAAGLANSLRGMGTGSQPSLWHALPALTSPTLLLCGELDEKYVHINQQMAELIPDSELVIVQGAGHNIHFEKPDEFRSAVTNFLPQATQNMQ